MFKASAAGNKAGSLKRPGTGRMIAPTLNFLLCQYEKMKMAFNNKAREIENRPSRKLNLSLKVIAHYGEMTEFDIGGFKRLYGEVVIEAHRLLKNSIPGDTYLLVTDSLKGDAAGTNMTKMEEQGIQSTEICEVYDGFRLICFSYFDFSNISAIEQRA